MKTKAKERVIEHQFGDEATARGRHQCSRCGNWVNPGAPINYFGKKDWIHAKCMVQELLKMQRKVAK